MALIQRHFLPANEIMKVMRYIPFHILLTNIPGQLIHILIHMIIGNLCNNLTIIVDRVQLHPASAEELTSLRAVSIVQSYNENVFSPKGTKMRASHDCFDSINMPDDNASYHHGFILMLEPFKKMWGGHICHMTTATDRVELNPLATRPIHSVSYRVGPKAIDFEKNKSTKLFH